MHDEYTSDDEPTIHRQPSTGANSSRRKSTAITLQNIPTDRTLVGEIKMTLDFDPDGNTLKIIIFGIRGIILEKEMDIYVKLYLQPDPKKVSKRKTRCEKTSPKLIYNETFVYHLDDIVKKLQAKPECLEVSVWQDAGITFSCLLAKVNITMKEMEASTYLSGWFPIYEEKKSK